MKTRIWNSMLIALLAIALFVVAFGSQSASAQVVVGVPPVVEEMIVYQTMRPVVVTPDQVPVTTYHPVVTPGGTVVYRPVTVHRPVVTTDTRAVVTYHPIVTTFSPVVTSNSPVVTTYRPIVGYRGAPVVVHPKVYVAGQPVRNLLRAITP